MYTNADKRLKELNALNQYQIEEVENSNEGPEIRFDDLAGTTDEEESLLISDDFVITEEDFIKKKEVIKQKYICQNLKMIHESLALGGLYVNTVLMNYHNYSIS